jgi:hypothetical protein
MASYSSKVPDVPLVNAPANEYYESHQRTPGQILSLTSNIEFSPFFNSSAYSPEYGRNKLADRRQLLANGNGSKINFQVDRLIKKAYF